MSVGGYIVRLIPGRQPCERSGASGRPAGDPERRMRSNKAPAFVAALALAVAATLGACGPQYETFASYAPPEDGVGRQCLAQCQGGRQLCRQSSSLQVQQCRLGAQQEAQTENLRLASEYQIQLQRYQAGLRQDAPDPPATVRASYWACDNRGGSLERQCAEDYDLCYQTCGGTVTYTTRCVANCE